MSKVCNNCGRPADDNAMFCTNCGANFAAPGQPPMNQPPMNQPPMNQPPMGYPQGQPPMAPAPKKPFMEQVKDFFNKAKNFVLTNPKAKKYGIIGGSVLAGIIVLIIALALIFPGPQASAKGFLKAIDKGNAEKIVSYAPDFYFEDDDDREESVEFYEEMLDELEDFEYEIKKVDKFTAKETLEMIEDLEYLERYYDDFDVKYVSGFCKVKVKVSYELDGSDYSDTWNIVMMKYRGQWKVYSGAFFG